MKTQIDKPGYKTTEFWLSSAVVICGILMSSGVIAEGSQAAQIIGGIMTVLASLGYTGARAQAKNATLGK